MINKYIINLGTKILLNNIDLLKESIYIFNKIKNNKDDILYGISFGNQFCEHLNIELELYINQIKKIKKIGIKIYYLTSIITYNNEKIIKKNIKLLKKIGGINFIINDYGLINNLINENIFLGETFYRTRVLIRKNLLENLIIPNEIKDKIDINKIKNNQQNIYNNTFDNLYYKKFILNYNIKGILIDIFNENIDNLNELNIEIINNTPYTYVMSGRGCITHKIINNINNNNVTENCNKECYSNNLIETNYSKDLLGKNMILSGNTIFTKNEKINISGIILVNNINL